MRLAFVFFLLLPSLSAELKVGDIYRDQINAPEIDEDVSWCFDGSQHSALCVTRANRKACLRDQNGEQHLDLNCLQDKIQGMCNKQNDLPQGDFQNCVYHFRIADLSLARDQCLTKTNPLSCFLQEAYYFCDGKFDCIDDSLDKICSSDCSDWKKVSIRLWTASTCKNLNCTAETIKEGCGGNKECSKATVENFCILTYKMEQEAINCVDKISKRIDYVPSVDSNENIEPVLNPIEGEGVPNHAGELPNVQTWPVQGPIPEPFLEEPNTYSQAAVDSNLINSTSNGTSEQTEKAKFLFEKKHWVAICACTGVALLIVSALCFFMYWQQRREEKKEKEGGDAGRKQKLFANFVDLEKAIDKKKDEKTSKIEKSKKETSKKEKSRKKTSKSTKESSKKEKSKKEMSKSDKSRKEATKSTKESSMSKRNKANSKTETRRKEEKTEKEESSGSDL